MVAPPALRDLESRQAALARRLFFHRCLTPLVSNMGSALILILIASFFIIVVSRWIGREFEKSLEPLRTALTLGLLFLYILRLLWAMNLRRLAAYDATATVGALLDLADINLRQRMEEKPKRERWEERLLFPGLPDLLDRMPAGDGPTLSSRQCATLRWLVNQPEFYAYFIRPGLSEKIDATLAQPTSTCKKNS